MSEIEKISSLADNLKENFDDKFVFVLKNEKKVPFNVNVILRDLYESGIDPFDSMKVLDEIHPHLYKGISIQKIIKLINQALQVLQIEKEFLKGSYLQPILIKYEDSNQETFNYKFVKDFLEKKLENFQYSSKTYRACVDELHRIILSMRSSTIQAKILDNMVPSVLRNVIGINPLSANSVEEDHNQIIKLADYLMNSWDYLPDSEKPQILISLFESIYRVVLLNFEFLPGHNTQSTIYMVNQLISHLTQMEQKFISDKEIYMLGKTSKEINDLIINSELNLEDKLQWFESIELLSSVANDLVNKGSLSWLIVTDKSGNEIYAKFSLEKDSKYRSLIGMAFSGVHDLVNELTDKTITQIQQDEGSSILIERDPNFLIIALTNTTTKFIRKKISDLAKHIRNELSDIIQIKNGHINEINKKLGEYVTAEMDQLFT